MPSSRNELAAANAAAHTHFIGHSGNWVRTYLAVRHLDSAATPWGLGYADAQWGSLCSTLRTQFADAVLLDAGLCTLTRDGRVVDVFRDRLTFPIRDGGGTVLGFTGRAKPGAAAKVPKYLNTKTTALFDKSTALFGIEHLREGTVVVLVEGPADAIAVTLSGGGRFAGVAACGSAWTSRHVESVISVIGPAGRVVIATDADNAGQKTMLGLYRQLSVFDQLSVDALGLPPGTDPAQLHRRTTLTAALRSTTPAVYCVARILIENHRDSLRWAEGRIAAVRAVSQLVLTCPSQLRDTLIGSIAAHTTMSPAAVRQTITADLAVDQGALA